LLPGKLVLIVAIHPLDGSRANWHFKAKPSADATLQHKMRILQAMSNPLEQPIVISCREGSRTPHKSIGEAPNNLQSRAQYHRCSKPFRTSGNTQEQQAIHSQLKGSSVTRCNSQSNALESHSISLGRTIKQRDEWKGCSLAQSMSQVFKESGVVSQGWPNKYL
jgi:hypothetical protein